MIETTPHLDTTVGYETPEGIALELRPAGPVVRGFAWAIDFAIRAACYLLVLIIFVTSAFDGVGTAVGLIFIFIVEWFYPVLFEMCQRATPGKKAMGLEVMQADGTPLGWPAALLRNLLRTADFFPFLYFTGLVAMVLNGNFQRLGDLAADTVVVYADRENGDRKIPGYSPKHPPRPLSLTEQRLVMDFAERGELLSAQRRRELASLLPFLVKDDKEPELTLLAYANWFSGSR